MADTFTRVDLESLLKAGNDHCLSLFMPTTQERVPGESIAAVYRY